MTSLLLLRHAESEWNAQGRWQGLADPPLSPRGEQQARDAAGLLRRFGFSAVVSSDLQRARRTAAGLAPALGLDPPDIDAGLREYDVGEWGGLTRNQIEAAWPGAIEAWREGRLASTPNGERRDAFIARITAAVERVAASHPSQTVLVITHGGVIGSLAHALGANPSRVAHLAGRWFHAGTAGVKAGEAIALLDPAQTARLSDMASDPAPTTVLDTPHR